MVKKCLKMTVDFEQNIIFRFHYGKQMGNKNYM